MLKFVKKIKVNKTKNNPIKLISITLLIGVLSPGCHSESKTLSKNELEGFFVSCEDDMSIVWLVRDLCNREFIVDEGIEKVCLRFLKLSEKIQNEEVLSILLSLKKTLTHAYTIRTDTHAGFDF